MATPEEEVLRPVDPSIANSDEWPIFELDHASVTFESNGKPASLLEAYADTPLKVQGVLLKSSQPDSAKSYIKKAYKPVEIEVRNVMRYSYGEMTDGEYVLWAQGKAGWFELRPAPAYKRLYEEASRAVEILFFISDIHHHSRRPSAALLFKEYAEDERFRCADPAEAEQIFRRHHIFLMMCFLDKANGIAWGATPLYLFLKKEYPEDFVDCKARTEGRFDDVSKKSQNRVTKSNSDARLGKGRATSATDKPPKKDENWWEASALFEFMQRAVNQRALRTGRITLQRVAELMLKRYEIEQLETAQNVLLVHAANLCYKMDHPRQRSVKYFTSEPIYQELSAGHTLSAVEQRKAEAVELRLRKGHGTLGSDDLSSSADEDAISTPVNGMRKRKAKGRLSVLRPKSGKYSAPTSGKGKAPLRMPDSSDEASEDKDDESDDDMVDIDTPTHASPSRLDKRKFGDTDMDEDDDEEERKKAAGTLSTPVESEPDSTSDNESATGEGIDLPLHHRPSNSTSAQNKLVPTIISSPLPTYEPNGPRDSWICSMDGCSQRIYGCSKVLGRQLITEHLEDHTKGREKVVGILWREQDKLHLPVNNLIKKIREMSESTMPLFPASAPIQPNPIQRPV